MWARAAMAVAVVWGCDVTLCRLSWAAPSTRDLLTEAALLVLIGVLPVLWLERRGAAAGRAMWVRAGLGVAPAALVATLAVVPSAVRAGAVVVLVTVPVVVVPPIVWAVRRGQDDPIPPPLAIVSYLAAAVAVSWAAELGGVPVLLWPVAVVWFLLSFSARRALYLPLPVLLAAVVAGYPSPPPTGVWAERAARSNGPDVVLVTVDTLRADTPLETVGMRDVRTFTAAWAPSTWTLPSVASILTGLAPSQHGALRRNDGRRTGIAEGVPTLAERLAEAGWDTAAVVAVNANLAGELGFDRGFDAWFGGLERARYARPGGLLGAEGLARPALVGVLVALGIEDRVPLWDADEVTRRAAAIWVKRRDRPVFLWVHYMDPHLPYLHARQTGQPGWRVRAVMRPGAALEGPEWTSEEGRAALRDLYTHEVTRVDQAVGDLLDLLGEPSARGRVVVVTSDHGEELGEHGVVGHGHALWEEVLHVPLAIGPGEGTWDGPVGVVSVAATVLDRVGVAHDLAVPGLAGAPAAGPWVAENRMKAPEPEGAFAVREGPLKVVVDPPAEAVWFDLQVDPAERAPRTGGPIERLVAQREAVPPPPSEAPRGGGVEGALLEELGYTPDP